MRGLTKAIFLGAIALAFSAHGDGGGRWSGRYGGRSGGWDRSGGGDYGRSGSTRGGSRGGDNDSGGNGPTIDAYLTNPVVEAVLEAIQLLNAAVERAGIDPLSPVLRSDVRNAMAEVDARLAKLDAESSLTAEQVEQAKTYLTEKIDVNAYDRGAVPRYPRVVRPIVVQVQAPPSLDVGPPEPLPQPAATPRISFAGSPIPTPQGASEVVQSGVPASARGDAPAQAPLLLTPVSAGEKQQAAEKASRNIAAMDRWVASVPQGGVREIAPAYGDSADSGTRPEGGARATAGPSVGKPSFEGSIKPVASAPTIDEEVAARKRNEEGRARLHALTAAVADLKPGELIGRLAGGVTSELHLTGDFTGGKIIVGDFGDGISGLKLTPTAEGYTIEKLDRSQLAAEIGKLAVFWGLITSPVLYAIYAVASRLRRRDDDDHGEPPYSAAA